MRRLLLAAYALATACSGSSTMPMMSTLPTAAPSSPMKGVAGMWTGTAFDSTGSMMGASLTPGMMSGMTWQIAQTDSAFTGMMQFPGYTGPERLNVSGHIDGETASITMSMTTGSMMTGTCTATAVGTVDFDDLFTEMHGTYSGTNSCTGSFTNGRISMRRQ
ncbi:MAG TPA: hypothetical protein VEL79_20860 [Vicinamibacterales bacterium]|nr:hypothetical protein [Vicinamibacterales bacterium]